MEKRFFSSFLTFLKIKLKLFLNIVLIILMVLQTRTIHGPLRFSGSGRIRHPGLFPWDVYGGGRPWLHVLPPRPRRSYRRSWENV